MFGFFCFICNNTTPKHKIWGGERGERDNKSDTSEISKHLNVTEGKVATFLVQISYKHYLALLPGRMISKTLGNILISISQEMAA